MVGVVFFFKLKTSYEMRISDWSSDVCSSDLHGAFWINGKKCDVPDVLQGALRYLAGGIKLGEFDRNAQPAGNVARHVYRHATELPRSEERRVGKEWVRTCRSRWSPYR